MSKLTDYGTLVLAELASETRNLASAGQVADATHIGRPTVSKLLKSLTRAGLVVSERGARGGYALARAPEQISAAQIIDALEGPVAITECSSVDGSCNIEQFCRVGRAWQRINRSIRNSLQQVSLADLQIDSEPPAGLNLKRDLTATTAQ
ncbi:SUF system Fe-S cluster assembly regulator [Candidatus Rariloculus sp.]|uniref:SUF system Fe-S cluster assembly regulator n=1 Tax=Candidatus Rariloculus sp. TaxID=3101265 RepID=UPI003D0C29B9